MPPGMKELIRSDMDKGFDFGEGLAPDAFAENEQTDSQIVSISA